LSLLATTQERGNGGQDAFHQSPTLALLAAFAITFTSASGTTSAMAGVFMQSAVDQPDNADNIIYD
jgi:hypothetical protein